MSQEEGYEKRDGRILTRLLGDKSIWGVVLALILISMVVIYTSTSALARVEHTSNWAYVLSQLKMSAAALFMLFIAYIFPVKWYKFISVTLFVVSICLLAITVTVGVEINGARRWLQIPGTSISFQTTELIKITLVLYLANIFESVKLDNFKNFFLFVLVPVAVTCVLSAVGSVSTALFFALLSFVLIILGGIKWRFILYACGIGLATLMLIIGVNSVTHWFHRIDTAVNRLHIFSGGKMKDSADTLVVDEYEMKMQQQLEKDRTFQSDMAKAAIADAGFFGKGPGNSTQRYVLPEAHSDFIFCIIVEEYGMVGAFIIIFLYSMLFARALAAVKRCSRMFSAMTVAGITICFIIQVTLHIFVNLGILPVTGHTLPLISLGGTSFILSCISLGIILSVTRVLDGKRS